MYKNNIVQKTKLIIRKLFKNIETPDDINQLQQILNYPAFVGSHSRNSGTKYMNDLYKELMIVNENLMAEIEEITKG